MTRQRVGLAALLALWPLHLAVWAHAIGEVMLP